ncbi:MAG: hypothetical protein K2K87_08955 [Lachnospiraceae bacterium]|nr:hypothetical protein [Lachnospiraceae bacterium]
MKKLRKLEELNLVDDFLANSLTSHAVYGEPAARCILECILGRKIGKIKVTPQRAVQGEDTDKHGIRMDVGSGIRGTKKCHRDLYHDL